MNIEKIGDFLASRYAGTSAKAICSRAMGSKLSNDHPYDPADFNRCLMCLNMTGIDISVMIGASEIWDKLVEHWTEIERCFIDEVGLNWCNGDRAEKTYNLMQKIMY